MMLAEQMALMKVAMLDAMLVELMDELKVV